MLLGSLGNLDIQTFQLAGSLLFILFFPDYRCLWAHWLENHFYLGSRGCFSLGPGEDSMASHTFNIWGHSFDFGLQLLISYHS